MASNSFSNDQSRPLMLIFAFFLSALALFLQAVIVPGISFLPFSCWLSLIILKSKKSTDLWKILWLASLAGLFTDLFSDHPFALHAITYCLASLFLYRFKNHFLYEKPFHLSLFTTLISFVCTHLQLFFLFLFDRRVPFAGKWMISDWIGMPIADGLFALVWFVGPLFLFSKTHRLWVLFWAKKSLSPNSR
jgi:cell shape-determining protein MreD